MIILDTNVVSVFMKRAPDEAVVAWLNRQPASSIWTTTITVFEIEFGLRRLPPGQRREFLESRFRDMLDEHLDGRVLAFDTQAALAAGALSASLQSQGRPIEIRDVQVAGIARARNATVATRNVKHFQHACEVCSPWESA